MTSVTVHFAEAGYTVSTAVVEVIGPDLDVRQASLDVENPVVVLDVDRGKYLVRTHFSDGGIDSRVMSLAADGDRWDVTPPRPDFPDPTYHDDAPLGGAESAYLDFDPQAQQIIRRSPVPSPRTEHGVGARQVVGTYPLRLWRMSDGSWEQLPIDEPARAVDGGLDSSCRPATRCTCWRSASRM